MNTSSELIRIPKVMWNVFKKKQKEKKNIHLENYCLFWSLHMHFQIETDEKFKILIYNLQGTQVWRKDF